MFLSKLVLDFGYAGDVIGYATRWAFDLLSCGRVEARVCVENVGYIRTLKRAVYRRLADSDKSLAYEVAPLKYAVLIADQSTYWQCLKLVTFSWRSLCF